MLLSPPSAGPTPITWTAATNTLMVGGSGDSLHFTDGETEAQCGWAGASGTIRLVLASGCTSGPAPRQWGSGYNPRLRTEFSHCRELPWPLPPEKTRFAAVILF